MKAAAYLQRHGFEPPAWASELSLVRDHSMSRLCQHAAVTCRRRAVIVHKFSSVFMELRGGCRDITRLTDSSSLT